jgi:hypothetical protein
MARIASANQWATKRAMDIVGPDRRRVVEHIREERASFPRRVMTESSTGRLVAQLHEFSDSELQHAVRNLR